jgi:hypothetical protein
MLLLGLVYVPFTLSVGALDAVFKRQILVISKSKRIRETGSCWSLFLI